GSGSTAAGDAFGQNDIGVTTEAYIDGGHVAGPAVDVAAETDATIKAIAAVGSGSGSIAASAAQTLNTIQNTTSTHVSGSAVINVAGDLQITATDDSTITSLAGTGAGSGTAAGALAIGTNDISNSIVANIEGATVTANSIEITADSHPGITVVV